MIAPHLQNQYFPVMKLGLSISACVSCLVVHSTVFHGLSWVMSAAALQHRMLHSLSSTVYTIHKQNVRSNISTCLVRTEDQRPDY